MSEIGLFCPGCKLRMTVARQDYDPPQATELHMLCPECCGGDFSSLDYFDKDGKSVSGEPPDRDSHELLHDRPHPASGPLISSKPIRKP
jgi:hypothetical protein